MQRSVTVIYYDGQISKPRQATIRPLGNEQIEVSYPDGAAIKRVIYAAADMHLLGKIGQTHPVLELIHDARIEFQHPDLPDWLPVDHANFQQRVWKLERTPSLILFSVVFVAALAFAVVQWAVPFSAKLVASQLPEKTLYRVGHQAEEYVIEYTEPSELSAAKQQQIKADYLQYVAEGRPAQLKFRKGDAIGANALALPNNTIYLTDELVELAKNNQEIIGVLAHEQGHLLKKHSLQQGLASLGLSVLYVGITGDSSDLAVTLPVALLGAGYSRKFETESDDYALQLLHRKQIDPLHLARFLQRMELAQSSSSEQTDSNTAQQEEKPAAAPEDQPNRYAAKVLQIFASHPATEERVQRAQEFARQHPVPSAELTDKAE